MKYERTGKGEVPAVSTTDNDGESGRIEATFVISVWYEAQYSQPFRARLTWTSGDIPGPAIKYAVNREAVLSEVSEWLSMLPST
jgi:hypothetical protein